MLAALLVAVSILAGVLGVVGGALVASLWHILDQEAAEQKRLVEDMAQATADLNKLFEQDEALRKELEDLKAAGPKRHTHSTTAGLEDALAIAIDVITEYDASRKYTEARIGQLRGALAKLREGPNAYAIENSAGKRPAKKSDYENV